MPVSIQLKQEGWVRSTGYQCTQWLARQPTPPGSTNPSSLADLFVFRRTGETEVLDRVATVPDLVNTAIPVSRLTGFVVRGTGGDLVSSVLAGDTITITKAVPHWIQGLAPYTDQVFRVFSAQVRNYGGYGLNPTSQPQLLPGSRLVLPGYVFTNFDVGRWILLQGFASVSYNTTVQILGIEGSKALVNLPTSTTETGAYWTMHRILIDPAAVSAGQEARYFPTREDGLTWTVTRGGSTIASGTGGLTERSNISSTYYRDHRVTTVEPTAKAAEERLRTTRQYVEFSELEQNTVDEAFTALQTFDYPPVTP